MFLQLALVVLATLQLGAGHDDTEIPIVVVSQHQLKKDIRKEVTAVVQQATANITDSINQVTKKVDWAVTDAIEPLRDEIAQEVNSALENAISNVTDTIEQFLKPLLDIFVLLPGKTSTNPATSCESVKAHNPMSQSGYYWIQTSNHPVVQVYCDMSEIELIRGKYPTYPATSCKDINRNSDNPSGYYWIKAANESSIRVYCSMTRSCGGITGGWMQVASVDMKNISHTCPQGLTEVTKQSKRLCTKTISTGGCSSAAMDVYGIEYTRICGKIISYQDGFVDAFLPYWRRRSLTIDDSYVDGVVLTHGTNPQKHIWTFAAVADEVNNRWYAQCGCSDTRLTGPNYEIVPPWVGNDYFCDTGAGTPVQVTTFYSDDPLWDGHGCGPTNACCSFNNPPWFSKQLSSPTTDNIDLRLCTDETLDDEATLLEIAELYVQ